MLPSDRTADSTFDRVAADLAHKPFPDMAGAIRARTPRILVHWRGLSMKAMPHLEALSFAEFEDSIGSILAAAADAFRSANPEHLRGVMREAPAHGLDRFVQRHSLLDLFEEVRILRGVVIVEIAEHIGRPLEVDESATFHAVFDVIVQQGVMALVNRQGEELGRTQTTMREMNGLLMASAVRHDEMLTQAGRMQAQIAEQAAAIAGESRRKDEFLAMLSHELRNPLAPIRSAVYLLRTREGSEEDPLQKQAHAIIERQVANLTKLVGDLLEVSRVVSGRIRLQLQVVDMNEIVRHAAETVTPLLEARRHTLVLSLREEPLWINAADLDPSPVRRVLGRVGGRSSGSIPIPVSHTLRRAWLLPRVRHGASACAVARRDHRGAQPALLIGGSPERERVHRGVPACGAALPHGERGAREFRRRSHDAADPDGR